MNEQQKKQAHRILKGVLEVLDKKRDALNDGRSEVEGLDNLSVTDMVSGKEVPKDDDLTNRISRFAHRERDVDALHERVIGDLGQVAPENAQTYLHNLNV